MRILNSGKKEIPISPNPLFDRLYNRAIQWGICLLAAFTPLVIIPQMAGSAITPKFIFSQVLLILLTGLWLIKVIRSGVCEIKKEPMVIFLPVFAAVYYVPSLFSETPQLSFQQGMTTLFWLCGVFVIVSSCRDEKSIRRIILSAIFGGVIAALYGLLQYLNMDFLHLKWEGRQLVEKEIMISTFGNANFFAAYLVPISLLVLTWGILSVKNIFLRFVNIVLAILLVGCITLSGVRSAWVDLPVTIVLGSWLYYRKRAKNKNIVQQVSVNRKYFRTVGWTAVVVGLILVFGLVISKYQVYKPDWLRTQLKSMQNIHELEERFLVWQIGCNIISRHPILGIGVGRFPSVFFPELKKFVESDTNHEYEAALDYINGANANHVHNDYLQLTAETGIFSFSILLWIILFFYYSQIKAIDASQDEHWRIQHIGLTVATFAFLLDAMVSFPFYLPANGLLFWILVGLTLAHSQLAEEDRVTKISIPKWGKRVGYLVTILFFIGFLIPTVKMAYASCYLKSGIGSLLMRNGQEALDYFQKSEELNPTVGETHYYLGKIYGITGQLDKAMEEYSLAEKCGMDNIDVYQDEAIFYYRNKEYQKAADEYEFITAVNPGNSDAHKWLSVIYTDYLPNRDKAIFHIQKYISTTESEKDREWFQKKLTELQNSK